MYNYLAAVGLDGTIDPKADKMNQGAIQAQQAAQTAAEKTNKFLVGAQQQAAAAKLAEQQKQASAMASPGAPNGWPWWKAGLAVLAVGLAGYAIYKAAK